MKFLKILGKIFGVIFSIVFFFALTSFMFVLFARNVTSGSYYSNIIKSIDLNSMKMSDLSEYFDIGDLDPNLTLEDALLDALAEDSGDVETARALIKDEEVRDIVGDFIGDFIGFYLGADKPEVSKKDLETILLNPNFIKLSGEKPTQAEIDDIYNDIVEGLEDAKEELKEGGSNNGNSGNYREVTPYNR